MGEFSILGRMAEEVEEPLPEYFADLNLDALIEEMGGGFEPYDLSVFFRRMPVGEADILYRQQILRDMEAGLEEPVTGFYRAVKQAQKYEQYAQETEDRACSAHWHLVAAYTYYEAFDAFYECLETWEGRSGGWDEFFLLCQAWRDGRQFQENHGRAMQVFRELSGIRYSMRIEEDHVLLLPRVDDEDYVGELCRRYPHIIGEPDKLYNILPGGKDNTELERRIIRYLKKKQPHIFREMEQFQETCPDFFQEGILKFHREVSFYLAFLKFRHQMERHSYSFCYPKFSRGDFDVRGGYDLALALKNTELGKETVVNDYYYHGEERFFVVTGPNQGGKTTFGRAAGQLVYFSLMGLPVPAESAELPLFCGLMTHFSVEESTESGRGKLKEELVRLAEMLQGRQKKAFVVINELFTSAATYDALHMGKQVMQYFLDDGCHGIYVTHIDKLAEESRQIVSMTASLREDGRERTYKIERRKAEGKGYAETIVEQFGLGYDEVVRRLERER